MTSCRSLTVGQTGDGDIESEPVEELRPKIPLFGVHGADEHEPGGMDIGNAFSFNHIDSGGCGVQQHVHQMIVQQVDLVHVENAPVGGCQKPGFEFAGSGFQSVFHMQGAHQPVFGCAQRKFHHGHGAKSGFKFFSGLESGKAILIHVFRVGRRTVIRTAGNDLYSGKDLRQGADGGRFCRSLMAGDQNTADGWIDGIENQGGFHGFLTDNGAERINMAFHDVCFLA